MRKIPACLNIGSTVLPEMDMDSDDCICGDTVPSGNGPAQPNNQLRNRLDLMRCLLASLCGSHRALLTMDLLSIEQRTSEQVVLSGMLAEEVRRRSTSSSSSSSKDRTSSSDCDFAVSGCPPGLKEELGQSEREVLQALRLQAALLMRARRKLRVLSNMRADPSLNYGPRMAQRQAPPGVSDFKSGGEI